MRASFKFYLLRVNSIREHRTSDEARGVKASGKLVVTVLQGKDDDGVMGINCMRFTSPTKENEL